MRLFNDGPRTRMTYKRYSESGYEFLNESSLPFVAQARERIQKWFDAFPKQSKPDWHARFTDSRDTEHIGAYFELLLHEMLLRLGLDVEVHPRPPAVSKRPDFLVSDGDRSFYLEAVVLHGSLENREVTNHEEQVYDWIAELANGIVDLRLEVDGVLTQQPSKGDLRPLADLLRRFDPNDVDSDIDEFEWLDPRSLPVPISIGEWSLQVWLEPFAVGQGSAPDSPGQVTPPDSTGDDDFISPITRKLRRKAMEKRSSALDAPLIIAVKVMSSMHLIHHDALPVMFGRLDGGRRAADRYDDTTAQRLSDGVWLRRNGEVQFRNLHGVWFFDGLTPAVSTPVGNQARLVLNPFVSTELPEALLGVPQIQVRQSQDPPTAVVNLDDLLALPLS